MLNVAAKPTEKGLPAIVDAAGVLQLNRVGKSSLNFVSSSLRISAGAEEHRARRAMIERAKRGVDKNIRSHLTAIITDATGFAGDLRVALKVNV
jgi:hypothetical protein